MTTLAIRKSALRLTQLHPADRNWILKQLKAEEATLLRRAIREVAELPHDVCEAALRNLDETTNAPRKPASSNEGVPLPPQWNSLVKRAANPESSIPPGLRDALLEATETGRNIQQPAGSDFLNLVKSAEPISGDES